MAAAYEQLLMERWTFDCLATNAGVQQRTESQGERKPCLVSVYDLC